MQQTTKNETSKLLNDIIEFYQLIEDEMDACHPEAFDAVYDIVTRKPNDDEIKDLLSDFNFNYGEDLEGCHDDYNEEFTKILKKYDIN